MPRFEYTARDTKAKVYRGVVDAASPAALAARLRADGYIVTSIKPAGGKSIPAPDLVKKRVTKRDLAVMCRQLGTLLKAGVPITEALNVTQGQTTNQMLRTALEQVFKDVQIGNSLSAALDKHSTVFPGILTRMVEAGEAAGTLDLTFDNLAEHFKREHELQAKIKGALTYPIVIMSIAILVVILLFTLVLPKFMDMFSGMGVGLPLPTRIMMSVGDFCQRYWWLVGLVIAAVVVGLGAYVKTESGQRRKDRIALQLPVIGKLLMMTEITRFSRTFGVMIAGGIPIVQAMNMIARLVGNTTIKEAFTTATDEVRRGGSLSAALAKAKIFPAMVTQMLEIGENTGSLDMMLDNIADFYDGEVDTLVKALTSLIEPIVILFLGGVVALVVMSVYLPMFQMMGGAGIR